MRKGKTVRTGLTERVLMHRQAPQGKDGRKTVCRRSLNTGRSPGRSSVEICPGAVKGQAAGRKTGRAEKALETRASGGTEEALLTRTSVGTGKSQRIRLSGRARAVGNGREVRMERRKGRGMPYGFL